MLKPSIQLRMGQHLTMTPQLQQAIRLLQLSTLELHAEIQQNIESNPMLEPIDENTEFDDPADGEDSSTEFQETHTEQPAQPENGADAPADELQLDNQWEDLYGLPQSYTGNGEHSGRDLFENHSDDHVTLRQHLFEQVRLLPLSVTDQTIAVALVDSIDDDGYLIEPLEAIVVDLGDEIEFEPDEAEAVLHLIQHLDPLGAGARDLSECLLLQLQQLPADTPLLEAAVMIARNHLDLLAAHDYKQLQRRLKLSAEELNEAVSLIQSMNPRPGAQIDNGTPEYVVPDVRVHKGQGEWRVELNPETAPRLRVNPLYASLVKRADHSRDNTFMRDQLQEARWFIKSLQSRNHTLLRVASAIVEHQRGFLEYGEEAMKPLVLREIAEQLEMHESTISRVTTQKYMHTPRGIFEFKYFFSSHVGTADGGQCSATAIRAMIKKLIDEENHVKPLSDSKIATILVSKGINVARRTVAKYREAMNTPPSNERKRLI